MSATETKVTIKKLNNENYQLWKFKMELILSRDDQWDQITKEKPDPAPADWDKKDRGARTTIGLLVEDDQLVHIRRQITAKGMWEALQKVHERANLNCKLYLLKKLYGMRFKMEQTMQEHINEMLETVERLRGIGEDVKDSNITALLLCSLPESYSPLIIALESRPENDLTLDYDKGKLLDEFKKKARKWNCKGND